MTLLAAGDLPSDIHSAYPAGREKACGYCALKDPTLSIGQPHSKGEPSQLPTNNHDTPPHG
jgi:hypothetical protein